MFLTYTHRQSPFSLCRTNCDACRSECKLNEPCPRSDRATSRARLPLDLEIYLRHSVYPQSRGVGFFSPRCCHRRDRRGSKAAVPPGSTRKRAGHCTRSFCRRYRVCATAPLANEYGQVSSETGRSEYDTCARAGSLCFESKRWPAVAMGRDSREVYGPPLAGLEGVGGA